MTVSETLSSCKEGNNPPQPQKGLARKKPAISKRGRRALPMNRKKKPPLSLSSSSPKQYTEVDILTGSHLFNKLPGNQNYRKLVMEFRETYTERRVCAKKIIDHIHSLGGRFLKMNTASGNFDLMGDAAVMTKVCKAVAELKPSILVSETPKVTQETSAPKKESKRPKRKASLPKVCYTNDEPPESKPKQRTLPSNQTRKPKEKSSKSKLQRRTLPSTQNRKPKDEPPRSKPKQRTLPSTQRRRAQDSIPVERREYHYKVDPNPFYHEESAYIYHNPPFPSESQTGVSIEELRPIPQPPPLPAFPNTGHCRWSFDEESRVLMANFSVNGTKSPLVTIGDSKFLLEMYERNDITVISRGLLDPSKLNPSLWSLEYLRNCLGREFYHKFRRFDRKVDKDGMVSNQEIDSLYSMRLEDYVEYLEKRMSYSKDKGVEPTMTFEDHLGETHEIGVWKTALYMIDLDINRLLPLVNQDFLKSFELPAVLPGGSHCMMHSVTPDARPFMGPNLYVTPPASFTHFHQDGHGTVDSGHLCIKGYNEVVMLRRLTERHKKHALWILSGKNSKGAHFDGLYSMPHGDQLGQKPPWPSNDMIEECRKMGYCPSLFTLEPGDMVHINKGRLHAFRKMSTSELPQWDCHSRRRRQIVESKGLAGKEELCVSVAWDWMYRGITKAGINRELCTVLEGSKLNKRNGVTSLAIPELALLLMARTVPAMTSKTRSTYSFLGSLGVQAKEASMFGTYEATKEEICSGISPGLSFVVGQHIKALNVSESNPKDPERGERLRIANAPDTQENPQICPLDPYGNSDFACKLCGNELSNVYFHCDGCETLLSKDFNICRGCWLQKKYMIKFQMHPSNPKRHATLNHMGDMKFDRTSKCPCKNGPACNHCGYCLGCSCRCHTWFTVRTRLCNAKDEERLLRSVLQCTVIQSCPEAETDSETKSSAFDVEREISYLRGRLKDAGDEELLDEGRTHPSRDYMKEPMDTQPAQVDEEQSKPGTKSDAATENGRTKDAIFTEPNEKTGAIIKAETNEETVTDSEGAQMMELVI